MEEKKFVYQVFMRYNYNCKNKMYRTMAAEGRQMELSDVYSSWQGVVNECRRCIVEYDELKSIDDVFVLSDSYQDSEVETDVTMRTVYGDVRIYGMKRYIKGE